MGCFAPIPIPGGSFQFIFSQQMLVRVKWKRVQKALSEGWVPPLLGTLPVGVWAPQFQGTSVSGSGRSGLGEEAARCPWGPGAWDNWMTSAPSLFPTLSADLAGRAWTLGGGESGTPGLLTRWAWVPE